MNNKQGELFLSGIIEC